MGQRLYTENDVRKLARGSELVLEPGDLATPAALDLAFQRGIDVVRLDADRADRAARAAAPKTSDAPASSFEALFAKDGSYVVEVRGGRPRVFRLTESGPVPLTPPS